jgi:hypothetical protein
MGRYGVPFFMGIRQPAGYARRGGLRDVNARITISIVYLSEMFTML